jgi:gas vesicle protein
MDLIIGIIVGAIAGVAVAMRRGQIDSRTL